MGWISRKDTFKGQISEENRCYGTSARIMIGITTALMMVLDFVKAFDSVSHPYMLDTVILQNIPHANVDSIALNYGKKPGQERLGRPSVRFEN